MSEIKISTQMDRMPLASETEADQDSSLLKDKQLFDALRRSLRCGCGGCRGDAINLREKMRGGLPKDEKGFVLNPFAQKK
jgi:hypothetical protein